MRSDRKSKTLLLATLLLLLITTFGCSNNYHVMIRNWVGIDERDLIRGWGQPAKTYESAGSKFFVYHEDGGSPTGCDTTFEIVGGVVDSFDYEGEGCVGDFNTHTYDRNEARAKGLLPN